MQRGGTASRSKPKTKDASLGKTNRQDSKAKSRPKSLQKTDSVAQIAKPALKRPSSGRKVARQPSVKRIEPAAGSPKARSNKPFGMKKELQSILIKKQRGGTGGGSSTKAIKTSVMKAILQQASHAPQKKQKKAEIDDVVTQMPWPEEELRLKEVPPIQHRLQYYVAQVVKSFMVEQGMLLAKEHLLQNMQYLQYLKLVNKPTDAEVAPRKLTLPRRPEHKGRKTVVFDLDETLIHCSDQVRSDCDCILPITFPSGEVINAGIYVRPFAKEVLRQLSKEFQVLVFTASHSCYANQVINYLDPEGKLVSHRLFREHCYQTEMGLYIKDLRVIDRPPSDLVLIDNAVYSYYFQMDNGIPIVPYHQGKKDAELMHLKDYLRKLLPIPDVRPFNRAAFKLDDHALYDDPIALLSELYPDIIEELENIAT